MKIVGEITNETHKHVVLSPGGADLWNKIDRIRNDARFALQRIIYTDWVRMFEYIENEIEYDPEMSTDALRRALPYQNEGELSLYGLYGETPIIIGIVLNSGHFSIEFRKNRAVNLWSLLDFLDA